MVFARHSIVRKIKFWMSINKKTHLGEGTYFKEIGRLIALVLSETGDTIRAQKDLNIIFSSNHHGNADLDRVGNRLQILNPNPSDCCF